jgi:hypothetical protein
MNHKNSLLLAMVCVCLAGCSAEKSEAKRFAKVLSQQAQALDNLDSQEASAIQSLQTWAAREAMMGGPAFYSPGNVTQKQTQASQEALNLKARLLPLSRDLTLMSQKLSTEKLTAPYIQILKSGLVQSLDARAQLIGGLDPLLLEYAQGIVSPSLQFGQRPACIDTIVEKLRAYQAPSNSVMRALQEIRTKYSVSDSDLAN